MTPEERDRKIEIFLAMIGSHIKKIAELEKETSSYKSMAKSEFELMSKLCPGRSEKDQYNPLIGMRYDCDCGPVFCEYDKCPMVHKGDRFDWEGI